METNSLSKGSNQIWDLDYKSTSDEEDNDSDESDDDYPVKKKGKDIKKKLPQEDVIMKLIDKDKGLVRRDLEARLERIKRK